MILKHRRSINFPELGAVANSVYGSIFQGLFRTLQDTYKNIYDDLNNLRVQRTSELPTAGKDYLGRFFLKVNASADDTLHVCIYRGATEDYSWRQVTIT